VLEHRGSSLLPLSQSWVFFGSDAGFRGTHGSRPTRKDIFRFRQYVHTATTCFCLPTALSSRTWRTCQSSSSAFISAPFFCLRSLLGYELDASPPLPRRSCW